MRRRPRLNSDIKLRATFLRCAAAAFFGGGSVFEGIPQSGGDRPMERQRKNQDEPAEPISALDLAGLQIEPSSLEIREHRLDAPAQAVVARAPWRRTIRHGDDPWLGLAFLPHHGDMGAGAFSGQRDVLQPVFAARETLRQGCLAAIVEHAQVLLAAQPPAPAVIATPGGSTRASHRNDRPSAWGAPPSGSRAATVAEAARCSRKPIAPRVFFMLQA